MKRFQMFQYAASIVASVGLVLPAGAKADETSSAAPPVAPVAAAIAPAIVDVCLGEAGTLRGQVQNAAGAALADTAVVVRSAGTEVATTRTDAEGNFSVAGLHGGIYEVSSAGGTGYFRLWAAGTNPPSANQAALIVADQQVTRGQERRAQQIPGQVTKGQIIFGTVVGVALIGGVVAWAVSEHRSSS